MLMRTSWNPWKGYHITVDESTSFTERTDSTFSFSIEAGQDTGDVNFGRTESPHKTE